MSNLHTAHFEETQRETQDERAAHAERIAAYVRSVFPLSRRARLAVCQYTPKRDKAALETTLQEGLHVYRADVIARISESILKCPSPTTDADMRKLEYYIREFTASVEEALTPLEGSRLGGAGACSARYLHGRGGLLPGDDRRVGRLGRRRTRRPHPVKIWRRLRKIPRRLR